MESLAKVLDIVFVEHLPALVFFSLSWLLIYGTVSFSDLVARKLLLRIPFYLTVQWKRRKLGLPTWRNTIGSGAPFFTAVPPELAVNIGKLYASVDERISRLRDGKDWVTKILSDESIYAEIVNIRNNEWTLLESDSALCEAASPDPKTSQSGLLSSVGNLDIPKNEVVGLLFHHLKVGTPEVQEIALFHMPRKITSPAQLEMLESIVTTLPAAVEPIGVRTVSEIRDLFARAQTA